MAQQAQLAYDIPTVQELTHKTRLYWLMSSTIRGRYNGHFTTKDGLDITRNTLKNLDPAFKLWRHFALLQAEIIRA